MFLLIFSNRDLDKSVELLHRCRAGEEASSSVTEGQCKRILWVGLVDKTGIQFLCFLAGYH